MKVKRKKKLLNKIYVRRKEVEKQEKFPHGKVKMNKAVYERYSEV